MTSRGTLLGNAVAGSTGPLYGFTGFSLALTRFANNTGHSGGLGLVTKGAVREVIQDLTLWQIRHIAIWGYSTSSKPTISNVRLADFSVGFLWCPRMGSNLGLATSSAPCHMLSALTSPTFDSVCGRATVGPNSESHVVRLQSVTVKDSLFVGRSVSNPICNSQTGVLLPIFAGAGYSISPSTCGPLGGHWTKGIYGMEVCADNRATLRDALTYSLALTLT